MTGTEESDRAVDRFASARLTVRAHRDGGKCFHCRQGGCGQHAWAVAELARHPGGRTLLRQLGLSSTSREKT
ncbi:hypothetical protein [Micromonospora endophytica]|uniref:Uncharacterized protein n=1 Tax=Micromonospora endophytica TaxID=515350 RepID=A0A2W2D4F3_9ACTN|nr:hypothetical protein [Micromonospora endophytica]PZF95489.1 hypothetical protein C1I93_15205 [Micromonospora endophytica]RIW51513.1 hypothetical protein D3H59_00655 [Micromonospora endophytica]BCJ62120.1 hypothetical protein Jiend_55420 [Micromonospora endophytica]